MWCTPQRQVGQVKQGLLGATSRKVPGDQRPSQDEGNFQIDEFRSSDHLVTEAPSSVAPVVSVVGKRRYEHTGVNDDHDPPATPRSRCRTGPIRRLVRRRGPGLRSPSDCRPPRSAARADTLAATDAQPGWRGTRAPISKAVSTMTNQMPDLALAGRASAASRAALCSAMPPLVRRSPSVDTQSNGVVWLR